MRQALSLVMADATTMRVYTLDEAFQAALSLGAEDGREAVATLSQDGQALRLTPSAGAVLSVPGYPEPLRGPVELDRDSAVLIGIDEPGHEGPLSVYIHPLTSGIARYARRALRDASVLEIGRDETCALRYRNMTVSSRHARLALEAGEWSVCDLGSANGTFVNGVRLAALQPHALHAGDVVRIADLVFTTGGPFLCTNEPEELLWQRDALGTMRDAEAVRRVGEPLGEGIQQGAGLPVFYPSPSFSSALRALRLTVDPPPAAEDEGEQPLIVQMGPSFFMGLCAVAMAAQLAIRWREGAGLWEVLPSLATSASLLAGSLIWPPVMRVFERRARAAHEALRTSRYLSYLDRAENELRRAAVEQQELLRGHLLSVDALMERAHTRSPQLMGHAVTEEGFLDVRLGIGRRPLEARITWPERRFSLQVDELWERLDHLKRHVPYLEDVPLAYSLATNAVTGIVGERMWVWEFVRGLVTQVCANYSYQDVKLALVVDEADRVEWEPLLPLPHLYDDGRRERRIALSRKGMARLEAAWERDLGRSSGPDGHIPAHRVFYLVICAHSALWALSQIAEMLQPLVSGTLASFVVLGQGVQDLPRECSHVIDLTGLGCANDASAVPVLAGSRVCPDGTPNTDGGLPATVFSRSDVVGTMRRFAPDIFVARDRMRRFSLDLARVRLKNRASVRQCPQELGFLELYGVGTADELEVYRRWEGHDASRSLAARVGRDARGMTVYLDLHERAQGPHGLIAGTTGSGKSEFIISLILSLCVSYAPDELSFVLIDYKGGGLAGAFDNARMRLPHLAGTVTNLDGEQIWRALASLRSELERRQRVLRDACERTGEATMDIHRYISLYRQGILAEPLPHLVVVADEFAELKQQEPEFMEELITAARIGRSLGVHLVLATQKPTGVVNEQIWSNARLKVSLKVADAADSKELLRRDDAAHLVRPGAFLLLVGYDEQFLGGQAAYAGGPYRPSEHPLARDEQTVELLDGEGEVSVSLRPHTDKADAGMSELNAVLAAVVSAAQARRLRVQPLWLPPLPDVLRLEDLCSVYRQPTVVLGTAGGQGAATGDGHGLLCAVGLADDPAHQRQVRIDVDVAAAGTVALFGGVGSEVERLLRTMLVSLLGLCPARGPLVYAIDYGRGLLAALSELPQVGGVVTTGDEEGVAILLHLLARELARRRSVPPASVEQGTPLPAVVLVLANVAALFELVPDFADWLATFEREGPRCGMYVLLSADRAGAVPYRLRAGVGVSLPTWLNDDDDYRDLLGSLGGMALPHRPCRGVADVCGAPLVFQGCVLEEDVGDEEEALALLARAGLGDAAAAPALPRLPERVTPEDLALAPDKAGFPIGLSKAGADTVVAPLHAGARLLVLGNERAALDAYVHGACKASLSPVLVVSTSERAEELLESMAVGRPVPSVAVVPHVTEVLERLAPERRAEMERMLAKGDATPLMWVLVSEFWCVSACYDEWLRVVSLAGEGLWIGEGFADQTVLRYPRQQPAYREVMADGDGFFVSHGKVERVRVVQECGDGRDERRCGDVGEGMGVGPVAGHAGGL